MDAQEFHRRVWEILKAVDDSLFEVVGGSAASADDIAAVEAATGLRVPEYLAGIVSAPSNTNGLAVIVREHVWPEPDEFSVGPAWTFWRGVYLLGIDVPDLPEYVRITTAHTKLAAAGFTDVLPLIKVRGCGNRFWGVNPSGAMVFVYDGEETVLEGQNLADVYAEQISDLLQRQRDMAQRLRSA